MASINTTTMKGDLNTLTIGGSIKANQPIKANVIPGGGGGGGELEPRVAALEEQVIVINQNMSSLQDDIDTINRDISALTDRVLINETDINTLNVDVTDLKAESEELTTRITVAEQTLGALQREVTALTTRLDNDEIKITALTRRLDNIQTVVDALSDDVSTLLSDVAGMKTKINTLEMAYLTLASNIQELTTNKANKVDVLNTKNLLNCDNFTATRIIAGINFTPFFSPEGLLEGVHINGTATSEAVLALTYNALYNNGTRYTLSGCTGGSASTYAIYWEGHAGQFDSEVTVTETATTKQVVKIVIRNGITMNNVMMYPMIRLATDPAGYEPYNRHHSLESKIIPVGYSYAEQDTGLTWIDGKKIYQKTFLYSNIGMTYGLSLNTDITGASMGWFHELLFDNDGTSFIINPIMDISGLAVISFRVEKDSSGKLSIRTCGNTTWASSPTRKYYITIRYTK